MSLPAEGLAYRSQWFRWDCPASCFFFNSFTLSWWKPYNEKFFSGLWSWQVNKWKVFALPSSRGRSNRWRLYSRPVLWFVIPELQEAPAESLVPFVFLSSWCSWKIPSSITYPSGVAWPLTYNLCPRTITRKLSNLVLFSFFFVLLPHNVRIQKSFQEKVLILTTLSTRCYCSSCPRSLRFVRGANQSGHVVTLITLNHHHTISATVWSSYRESFFWMSNIDILVLLSFRENCGSQRRRRRRRWRVLLLFEVKLVDPCWPLRSDHQQLRVCRVCQRKN